MLAKCPIPNMKDRLFKAVYDVYYIYLDLHYISRCRPSIRNLRTRLGVVKCDPLKVEILKEIGPNMTGSPTLKMKTDFLILYSAKFRVSGEASRLCSCGRRSDSGQSSRAVMSMEHWWNGDWNGRLKYLERRNAAVSPPSQIPYGRPGIELGNAGTLYICILELTRYEIYCKPRIWKK
jgi:hypothetical protein